MRLVAEGGGQLSIVLVGHPKLKNDLRRPKMEEIGDRTTVFEFGGLRDRQRDYIDWVLKASLDQGVSPEDVVTDEAATLLAAKLKTPLQIGQHGVRTRKCTLRTLDLNGRGTAQAARSDGGRRSGRSWPSVGWLRSFQM